MVASTSFVVDYGDSADRVIETEVHEDDNGGISNNFLHGTTVHFRVYAKSDVQYTIRTSSGSVGGGAAYSDLISESEEIKFPNTREGSTSKPIIDGLIPSKGGYNDNLGVLWMGANGGNLSIQGDNKIIAAAAPDDFVGVGRVAYNTEWKLWSLTFPSGITPATHPKYSIVVFIQVTN